MEEKAGRRARDLLGRGIAGARAADVARALECRRAGFSLWMVPVVVRFIAVLGGIHTSEIGCVLLECRRHLRRRNTAAARLYGRSNSRALRVAAARRNA